MGDKPNKRLTYAGIVNNNSRQNGTEISEIVITIIEGIIENQKPDVVMDKNDFSHEHNLAG